LCLREDKPVTEYFRRVEAGIVAVKQAKEGWEGGLVAGTYNLASGAAFSNLSVQMN